MKSAVTRLHEIADRTEREADHEDDGYAAHELREKAVFLRKTADLLATAIALLHHDDTCRDFACLMRDGCPERQTLMDAHNEATNDYARLEAAT